MYRFIGVILVTAIAGAALAATPTKVSLNNKLTLKYGCTNTVCYESVNYLLADQIEATLTSGEASQINADTMFYVNMPPNFNVEFQPKMDPEFTSGKTSMTFTTTTLEGGVIKVKTSIKANWSNNKLVVNILVSANGKATQPHMDDLIKFKTMIASAKENEKSHNEDGGLPFQLIAENNNLTFISVAARCTCAAKLLNSEEMKLNGEVVSTEQVAGRCPNKFTPVNN